MPWEAAAAWERGEDGLSPPRVRVSGGADLVFPLPQPKPRLEQSWRSPRAPQLKSVRAGEAEGEGGFYSTRPKQREPNPPQKQHRESRAAGSGAKGFPKGNEQEFCAHGAQRPCRERLLAHPPKTHPAPRCLSCRKSLIYPNREQSHARGRWNPKSP